MTELLPGRLASGCCCPAAELFFCPASLLPGGLGDDEVDVAVFRFTLGIPGFDDSNIPRVIGTVVAALVAVNHVLGAQPAPPAQVCSLTA